MAETQSEQKAPLKKGFDFRVHKTCPNTKKVTQNPYRMVVRDGKTRILRGGVWYNHDGSVISRNESYGMNEAYKDKVRLSPEQMQANHTLEKANETQDEALRALKAASVRMKELDQKEADLKEKELSLTGTENKVAGSSEVNPAQKVETKNSPAVSPVVNLDTKTKVKNEEKSNVVPLKDSQSSPTLLK